MSASPSGIGSRSRNGDFEPRDDHARNSTDSRLRWYAVNCQRGREELAFRNLRQQSFSAYLPRMRQTVRLRGQMETRTVAFFPSYLFVQFDVAVHRWRSVNGTLGVKSLVVMGGAPTPAPRGLVERLIDMTDERSLLDFSTRLKQGDQVRLVAGPFADLLGTLERMDESGRVRVLVDIMNGTIPLTMNIRDIAPTV